jgi:hypothetical protein
MRTVVKLAFLAVLGGLAAGVALNSADIMRYLKIRRM